MFKTTACMTPAWNSASNAEAQDPTKRSQKLPKVPQLNHGVPASRSLKAHQWYQLKKKKKTQNKKKKKTKKKKKKKKKKIARTPPKNCPNESRFCYIMLLRFPLLRPSHRLSTRPYAGCAKLNVPYMTMNREKMMLFCFRMANKPRGS